MGKVTTRCLYFTTCLVLYKLKLSVIPGLQQCARIGLFLKGLDDKSGQTIL